MLQQVMDHIHNYFIKTPMQGNYEIRNGVISLFSSGRVPAVITMLDGQRFWIVGSVMNDGVYTYHPYGIMDDDDKNAAGLQDETFTGTICALAVPPTVIALSEEISQWVDKNGAAAESPYQSENVIGVYSYTKATGGSGAGGSIGWQDVYASRLNRWRKVSL